MEKWLVSEPNLTGRSSGPIQLLIRFTIRTETYAYANIQIYYIFYIYIQTKCAPIRSRQRNLSTVTSKGEAALMKCLPHSHHLVY